MNYRHAYHAGNFADVLKHVVITRIVEYLKRKDKAFRVIDTHAGRGVYDLSSDEAQKTGEWREGIGRITETTPPDDAAALMKPYLDAVAALNEEGGIRHYPGSPVLTRALLRRQDRLTAIELHTEDAAALRDRFAGDHQARIIELDGWLALGAHVPPKEKRGLVLVDPPFEKEGEFERLANGLARAHRRWPGGIYALWYPIKDVAAVARFREALAQSGIARILDISLMIREPSAEPRLDGSGMIVVNPPYTLEAELSVLVPFLHDRLARARGAPSSVQWLTGEEDKA
ncbi:23S rRNA (adenine(2030)-N(6))-methyltransferase RlmJ [Mesorhizobium xinjiangense]|uniref:23S rRNA (adenine(2030)-N(6))-methyltransferase RlmJ n=1 Tax=Mesorhizobium xinjiangense TaxID=2678685 RepID=UPI0012EE486C|nr:23S rRNA (adenine(2030)-N(6))-methyltransferase RlmJ [Mesorhizobium xinjiangense]